jgi:low affinity Fe/Cu permease
LAERAWHWYERNSSDSEELMTRFFARTASYIAQGSGRPATFLFAVLLIVVWAITGPLFHYSDAWQLVINTGTTIITFLMVFIIQNTQNRDGAAIQAKLDELIRTSKAQNTFIGIENLTADEIEEYRQSCAALAKKAAERAAQRAQKAKASKK